MIDGTIVEGRLVRDPQQHETGDKARVSFTLAVPRPYKPPGAQYPESDFYYIVAYREKAERLMKMVKKGDVLRVQCRYRQYKKQGSSETSHLFDLVEFRFPMSNRRQDERLESSAPDASEDYPNDPNLTDDDLPF